MNGTRKSPTMMQAWRNHVDRVAQPASASQLRHLSRGRQVTRRTMGQRRSDAWFMPFTVMIWNAPAAEINADIRQDLNQKYSLEGLMLKLKLQYFGHLMRRTDSLEKP